MPVKDLVDVRIFCDGKAVNEYKSPGVADKDDQAVRYIEVETGARFEVNITWLPGFRVYPESGLYYDLIKDDETYRTCDYFPYEVLPLGSGALESPVKGVLSKTVCKNASTGQHEELSWAFEAIETSRHVDMPFFNH